MYNINQFGIAKFQGDYFLHSVNRIGQQRIETKPIGKVMALVASQSNVYFAGQRAMRINVI